MSLQEAEQGQGNVLSERGVMLIDYSCDIFCFRFNSELYWFSYCKTVSKP